MPGRSNKLAACVAFSAGVLTLGLTACGKQLGTSAIVAGRSESAVGISDRGQREHLPLRLPIAAVMTGTINKSSYEIFQAATAVEDLSESDWLGIGEAAVNLVGAATLITIAGTGPQDATWTSDPRWQQLSADMQAAGLSVGAAASHQDRGALTESTSRLAQACQSCHLVFSPRLLTSPVPALEKQQ
jgi:hypothetical protein